MAKKRKCNKKCRTNRAIAAVAAKHAHGIVLGRRASGQTITWGAALKKGWKFAKQGKKGAGDAHLKLRKQFKKAHRVRRRNARKKRNQRIYAKRETEAIEPLLGDL